MHMFSQPQNDLDYYDPIEYPMSRFCTQILIHRADRYLLLCRPHPRDVTFNKGADSSVVVFLLTSLLGDIVERLGEMGLSLGMRHTVNYPDSKVHGANMGPIWGRQDELCYLAIWVWVQTFAFKRIFLNECYHILIEILDWNIIVISSQWSSWQ